MICPQTGSECNATPCLDYGCCGPSEPPPPDMAEIERLAGDVSMALSTLMAAIKKLY